MNKSVVRKKDTGAIYAMKVMLKNSGDIYTEVNIMKKLEGHPFFPKLYWIFETEKKVYLVMDLCPGGELYDLLNMAQKLNEADAKFYFAELVLAIEYMHSKKILYRDLKPENVLLDIDGHIKLIDFGLSKENISLSTVTSSFCGSPEYMSPEMLVQSGHTLSVDMYSLGVILYELVTGLPPHYSTDQKQMLDSIVNSKQSIALPRAISMPGKFLISGLLVKCPDRRLGARKGIEEVKEHPWCEDCDWDQYLSKKAQPPYIPSIYGPRWKYVGKPSGRLSTLTTVQTSRGTHTESEWPGSTTGSRICTIETPKQFIEGDGEDLVPEEMGKSEHFRRQLPVSPLTKKTPGYHPYVTKSYASPPSGKVGTARNFITPGHSTNAGSLTASLRKSDMGYKTLGRNTGKRLIEPFKTVAGESKKPATPVIKPSSDKGKPDPKKVGIVKGRKSEGPNKPSGLTARKVLAHYK